MAAVWPPTPAASPRCCGRSTRPPEVKPQLLGAPAHRAATVRPGAAAASHRRQRHGETASGTVPPRSAAPNLRRAQRHRSCTSSGRSARHTACAFRNRLGLEPGHLVGLFAGHNFALKGLGPLLEALALRRRQIHAAAFESICWFAAVVIWSHLDASPAGSAWVIRFIFWVSIRELKIVSGPVTFLFSPHITTRARSLLWKPWLADFPSSPQSPMARASFSRTDVKDMSSARLTPVTS